MVSFERDHRISFAHPEMFHDHYRVAAVGGRNGIDALQVPDKKYWCSVHR